jgi:hypothetical protein
MKIKKEKTKLEYFVLKVAYHNFFKRNNIRMKGVKTNYKVGKKTIRKIKKYQQLVILHQKYLRSINYLKE